MASTRTPAQAISLLRLDFRKLDDSSFAIFASDEALKRMWRDYPWKSSLVELPPFHFTPNEPDTDPVEGVVPGDFLALTETQLRVVDGEIHPLDIRNYLPKSTHVGQPTAITYNKELAVFRCHPSPSNSWGAPWAQVEGVYKKQSTTIDMSNMESTLPFDDQHFGTFVQVLKYIYYDIIGDPRSGEIQFIKGRPFYTGQLAKYKEALESSVIQENLWSGARQIAPSRSLALG